MNREQLQRLASEWVRMAKNDIRNKVISFIREVETTERELAYALSISEGEMAQILEGNGEISLSTFAKLLIATGNALEIKPIEATPIRDYENIPSEEELRHTNIFGCPSAPSMPPHFGRPTFSRPMPPTSEEDGDDFVPPTIEEIRRAMAERPSAATHRLAQPRDERGRFASTASTASTISTRPQMRENVSPFESKTIDELRRIIRERLWDSEINIGRASKAELVSFLDEKNKRMNEYKRIKALEEDPKVLEFKNKMKNTIESNPHLREWFQKFINDIG